MIEKIIEKASSLMRQKKQVAEARHRLAEIIDKNKDTLPKTLTKCFWQHPHNAVDLNYVYGVCAAAAACIIEEEQDKLLQIAKTLIPKKVRVKKVHRDILFLLEME